MLVPRWKMVGAEVGAGEQEVKWHLQVKWIYTLKEGLPIAGFRIPMDVKWRVTDTSIPNQAGWVVL